MAYELSEYEIQTRAKLRAIISECNDAQAAADRQLQALSQLCLNTPPGPALDCLSMALDEVDVIRRRAITLGGLLRSAIERGPFVETVAVDREAMLEQGYNNEQIAALLADAQAAAQAYATGKAGR